MKTLKKILFLSLATMFIASCSNEEIESPDDIQQSPLKNMISDLSNDKSNSGELGSKSNPIVIAKGDFIYDFGLRYTIPNCDPNAINNNVPVRYSGNNRFYRNEGNGAPEWRNEYLQADASGNCLEPYVAPDEYRVPPSLKFGKYYRIYGELVRLTADENFTGSEPLFFYKDIPNSNKIRKVTFTSDNRTGPASIGDPIDYPFQIFDCEALAANNGILNGERYDVRDSGAVTRTVVFNNGYSSQTTFYGKCADNSSDDTTDASPCDNVNEWQSGVSYAIGKQVTYRGYLYTRVNGGWNRITKCD